MKSNFKLREVLMDLLKLFVEKTLTVILENV